MLRRWSLGLSLSVLLHAVAVGGVLATVWLRGGGGPVDVELTGMSLDDIKDLPLGPPPGGARAGAQAARARARSPRAPEESGTLASREDSARSGSGALDASDDEAAARISDLRQLGPEGSRLTVLLRVDRLKATPYAAAVDELLVRLPDRRDLLDGTGLDLYESFDALLISTPNPRDPAVTFLAARHRLSDAVLRAAIDRGARATGRLIAWRTERGRPFAERRARVAAGSSRRDERIIVLPAPGLVVVTPPLYRSLLLAAPRRGPSAADGGVADGADAGARDASSSGPPSWRALLRRIDAEDGVLPPDGIAMLSAVDIFKPATASARDTAVFLGMEVPRVVTAVLGADPAPFLEITAEFASEAEARHWEAEWPTLKRRWRVHPYVVLSGFSALVARAALSRSGEVIRLHETATPDETVRLLQFATHALGG